MHTLLKLPLLLLTLIFASLLLASPLAAAQNKGILSLQVENDAFIGLDRHYTSGLLLSYLPLSPLPNWVAKASRALGLANPKENLSLEYALGNTIFTPKDFESTQPLPEQRPWAGYSFASISVYHFPVAGENKIKTGDKFQLTVGQVGKASGSEWAQAKLHEIIGSPEPGGWDYQLKNELTLNLQYFKKWLIYQQLGSQLQLEWSPLFSLAVGTPYTYASAGFTLRLGPGLKHDYGPPTVLPNYPGSAYFVPGKPWSWYVMTGFDYRYMQYNMFLDGSLMRSSPSIEKNKQVDDFFFGAALIYKKFRTGLSVLYRSPEFINLSKRDVFAAINFSIYL